MEPNLCDVNHLDGDVVLPPRKRLLAGMRRHSPEYAEGSLQLSLAASAASASTPPSSPTPLSYGFNARLASLIRSYRRDLSPKEIAEASKSAAAAATKAAKAARAAAEDKAAIAAQAMASAKNALDLVASFSDESPPGKERQSRKNKLKKHIPVQLLYKKYQPVENCKKDEELARKLHRAINSSPRITKNSSGSDSRDHHHKRKKPKVSNSSERAREPVGGLVLEQNHVPSSNGHVATVQVDI